jgi:hypothetical protein
MKLATKRLISKYHGGRGKILKLCIFGKMKKFQISKNLGNFSYHDMAVCVRGDIDCHGGIWWQGL